MLSEKKRVFKSSGSYSPRAAQVLSALAIFYSFTGILQAQTFAPAGALAFTKAYGGANPLPQTLTIASTGAASISFTATPSTTTGGAWLSVSGLPFYPATPQSMTVSVNPSVALAAGTYTGQILVKPSTGTSMIVPVTLTIAPVAAAFFDNVPGQVSFSFKTNGTKPPAQSLDIRNGGTGALNWTLTRSTAIGANWLTVSAASGTAPSTVTVDIVPGALPGGGLVAGVFTGQLLLQAPTGNVTIPVSVVVAGNALSQVNALSFTKRYGGADPLPQTVTIASTGASISFTATSSTAKGGDWLSVSGLPFYPATPQPMTVEVHPNVTLAAGTYTGQIVITPSAGIPMTIPVTLTIAPSGGAFFDNLPGQVSFSMKTAGTKPPAQSVDIRNGGSGAFSWTLTRSTADGGNWLSISAASGTAPSLVNVDIVPSVLPGGGLLAGTFTGQLVFRSSTGNVTIPVSVTVGESVFSQANALSFAKPYGGADPLPQTLTIGSTGASISFTATSSTATGGNWLVVSGLPFYPATPQAMTVSVKPLPTLPAGIYTGQIVISSTHSSMTVPVTLTVAASSAAFFDNLPGQMSFAFKKGGTKPPAQSVEVRNAGAGSLNWTVARTTSDSGNWLTVSPAAGVAPSTVVVNIVPSALPGGGLIAGTFTGQLLFRAPGVSVTVPVSVVVGDSVFGQVNALSFTKVYAGPNPLPQSLTIGSSGASIGFTATSSTATGGNWLSVSGLPFYPATPEAMTVSVTPSPTLAAGTYTGQIVLSAPGSSITVPVILTVAPAGSAFFDNLPGQVSFSFDRGGKKPPAQPIEIRNAGAGALDWTLTRTTADGGTWLSISASTGAAPSLVNVDIIPTALPGGGLIAGTFTGQLVFDSPSGTVTVPVSVVVGDNVFSQVNALNFTKPFGGANPLPQVLTIGSTGATISFTAATSTGRGGDWLSISGLPFYPATSQAFKVSVNPSPTLAAGTYTGQIVISTADNASMTVPVTLTIAPTNTAFFDNVPGHLSFSFKTGVANPPAQELEIRNGGTGTLNWTLARSTADGGNWLTISAASGAAPSIVNVDIVPSALPGGGLVAGTFTGQLIFRSPGGSVTVPVSVVVGANVFNQLPPLRFSKPVGGANPAAQPIVATGTGAAFYFTPEAFAAKGGSWLTLSGLPSYPATPQTMNVGVNASPTLAAGVYTGQIVFREGSMAMTVPVYLTVGTPPVSVVTTSGTPQSAATTKPFALPLVATVKNSSGVPVSGRVVTFTAPATGASCTFAGGVKTATTDAQGRATSAICTANGTAGSYNVTATTPGAASPAPFALINTGATLTAIAVTTSSSTVFQGTTRQMTATGTYNNGTTANITAQVAWSSSLPAVATIGPATGLLTALTPGTTLIRATLGTVLSNSLQITVVVQPAGPVVESYKVLFGSQNFNVTGMTRIRLPWNIQAIQVTFTEPMTTGTLASLGGVTAKTLVGLGTKTLTWTFAPVARGNLATTLSGSGANALKNAAGIALNGGAGFAQPLKVYWGDFNDDGLITALDVTGVTGAMTGTYNIFADMNGDNDILECDLDIVMARVGALALP